MGGAVGKQKGKKYTPTVAANDARADKAETSASAVDDFQKDSKKISANNSPASLTRNSRDGSKRKPGVTGAEDDEDEFDVVLPPRKLAKGSDGRDTWDPYSSEDSEDSEYEGLDSIAWQSDFRPSFGSRNLYNYVSETESDSSLSDGERERFRRAREMRRQFTVRKQVVEAVPEAAWVQVSEADGDMDIGAELDGAGDVGEGEEGVEEEGEEGLEEEGEHQQTNEDGAGTDHSNGVSVVNEKDSEKKGDGSPTTATAKAKLAIRKKVKLGINVSQAAGHLVKVAEYKEVNLSVDEYTTLWSNILRKSTPIPKPEGDLIKALKKRRTIVERERGRWQDVKLFISSTFTDTFTERDILVKNVVPQLRLKARNIQLNFVYVDLRWGVPKDTSSAQTLMACMKELAHCRQLNGDPFFLAIVGDRCGWTPDVGEGGVTHEIKESFEWEPGLSVTAMEIVYGAFRTGNPNAFFYLRENTAELMQDRRLTKAELRKTILTDNAHESQLAQRLTDKMVDNARNIIRRDFRDELGGEIGKLNAKRVGIMREMLKKRFEGTGQVVSYTAKLHHVTVRARNNEQGWWLSPEVHMEDLVVTDPTSGKRQSFEQDALRKLWQAIDSQYSKIVKPVDVEDEEVEAQNHFHDFFLHNRSDRFVGRAELLKVMEEFSLSDDAVNEDDDEAALLYILADAGSGKSALMAKHSSLMDIAAKKDRVMQIRRHKGDFPERTLHVLYHFVGCGPGSTLPQEMMMRLCQQLGKIIKSSDGPEVYVPPRSSATFGKLVESFAEMLRKLPKQIQLVLIVDAVNQLDPTYLSLHDLVDWLPPKLPSNVRCILSCLPGELNDHIQERWPTEKERRTEYLRAMERGEQMDLVKGALASSSAKRLDIERERSIPFTLSRRIYCFCPKDSQPVETQEEARKRFGKYYEIDKNSFFTGKGSFSMAVRAKVRAVTDHYSTNLDELNFRKGDVVTLLSQEQNKETGVTKYTGKLGETKGYFYDIYIKLDSDNIDKANKHLLCYYPHQPFPDTESGEDGDLAVAKDEELEILSEGLASNARYWKCRNSKGQEGRVWRSLFTFDNSDNERLGKEEGIEVKTDQMGALLHQNETESPLWLIVACEELRIFGKFEEVDKFIINMAQDLPGLFHQVLDRLEDGHSRAILEKGLPYIHFSRVGLLEFELLELVPQLKDQPVLWSKLRLDLEYFLRPSSTSNHRLDGGFIAFFHGLMGMTVADRYVSSPVEIHREMAEYFQKVDKLESQMKQGGQKEYPRALNEMYYHQRKGGLSTTVTVAVRVRPLLPCEETAGGRVVVETEGRSKTMVFDHYDPSKCTDYDFDFSIWSADEAAGNFSSQKAVFNFFGKDVVTNMWEGFAVSLFAYGQQLSGKTSSMFTLSDLAENGSEVDDDGLAPRICRDLFDRIEKEKSQRMECKVDMQFLLLDGQEVIDMLQDRTVDSPHTPNRGSFASGEFEFRRESVGFSTKELDSPTTPHSPISAMTRQMRRTTRGKSIRDVHLQNGTVRGSVWSEPLESAVDVIQHIRSGLSAVRTHKNVSLCHKLVTIRLTRSRKSADGRHMEQSSSKLYLADLASSQRHSSLPTNDFKSIQQTLAMLQRSIFGLAQRGGSEDKDEYLAGTRDQNLSKIMKDALGGKAKTILLVCVSPSSTEAKETNNALKYAEAAKKKPVGKGRTRKSEAPEVTSDDPKERQRREKINHYNKKKSQLKEALKNNLPSIHAGTQYKVIDRDIMESVSRLLFGDLHSNVWLGLPAKESMSSSSALEKLMANPDHHEYILQSLNDFDPFCGCPRSTIQDVTELLRGSIVMDKAEKCQVTVCSHLRDWVKLICTKSRYSLVSSECMELFHGSALQYIAQLDWHCKSAKAQMLPHYSMLENFAVHNFVKTPKSTPKRNRKQSQSIAESLIDPTAVAGVWNASRIRIGVRLRPFNLAEETDGHSLALRFTGQMVTVATSSGGERTNARNFDFDFAFWSHEAAPDDESEIPHYAVQEDRELEKFVQRRSQDYVEVTTSLEKKMTEPAMLNVVGDVAAMIKEMRSLTTDSFVADAETAMLLSALLGIDEKMLIHTSSTFSVAEVCRIFWSDLVTAKATLTDEQVRSVSSLLSKIEENDSKPIAMDTSASEVAKSKPGFGFIGVLAKMKRLGKKLKQDSQERDRNEQEGHSSTPAREQDRSYMSRWSSGKIVQEFVKAVVAMYETIQDELRVLRSRRKQMECLYALRQAAYSSSKPLFAGQNTLYSALGSEISDALWYQGSPCCIIACGPLASGKRFTVRGVTKVRNTRQAYYFKNRSPGLFIGVAYDLLMKIKGLHGTPVSDAVGGGDDDYPTVDDAVASDVGPRDGPMSLRLRCMKIDKNGKVRDLLNPIKTTFGPRDFAVDKDDNPAPIAHIPEDLVSYPIYSIHDMEILLSRADEVLAGVRDNSSHKVNVLTIERDGVPWASLTIADVNFTPSWESDPSVCAMRHCLSSAVGLDLSVKAGYTAHDPVDPQGVNNGSRVPKRMAGWTWKEHSASCPCVKDTSSTVTKAVKSLEASAGKSVLAHFLAPACIHGLVEVVGCPNPSERNWEETVMMLEMLDGVRSKQLPVYSYSAQSAAMDIQRCAQTVDIQKLRLKPSDRAKTIKETAALPFSQPSTPKNTLRSRGGSFGSGVFAAVLLKNQSSSHKFGRLTPSSSKASLVGEEVRDFDVSVSTIAFVRGCGESTKSYCWTDSQLGGKPGSPGTVSVQYAKDSSALMQAFCCSFDYCYRATSAPELNVEVSQRFPLHIGQPVETNQSCMPQLMEPLPMHEAWSHFCKTKLLPSLDDDRNINVILHEPHGFKSSLLLQNPTGPASAGSDSKGVGLDDLSCIHALKHVGGWFPQRFPNRYLCIYHVHKTKYGQWVVEDLLVSGEGHAKSNDSDGGGSHREVRIHSAHNTGPNLLPVTHTPVTSVDDVYRSVATARQSQESLWDGGLHQNPDSLNRTTVVECKLFSEPDGFGEIHSLSVTMMMFESAKVGANVRPHRLLRHALRYIAELPPSSSGSEPLHPVISRASSQNGLSRSATGSAKDIRKAVNPTPFRDSVVMRVLAGVLTSEPWRTETFLVVDMLGRKQTGKKAQSPSAPAEGAAGGDAGAGAGAVRRELSEFRDLCKEMCVTRTFKTFSLHFSESLEQCVCPRALNVFANMMDSKISTSNEQIRRPLRVILEAMAVILEWEDDVVDRCFEDPKRLLDRRHELETVGNRIVEGTISTLNVARAWRIIQEYTSDVINSSEASKSEELMRYRLRCFEEKIQDVARWVFILIHYFGRDHSFLRTMSHRMEAPALMERTLEADKLLSSMTLLRIFTKPEWELEDFIEKQKCAIEAGRQKLQHVVKEFQELTKESNEKLEVYKEARRTTDPKSREELELTCSLYTFMMEELVRNQLNNRGVNALCELSKTLSAQVPKDLSEPTPLMVFKFSLDEKKATPVIVMHPPVEEFQTAIRSILSEFDEGLPGCLERISGNKTQSAERRQSKQVTYWSFEIAKHLTAIEARLEEHKADLMRNYGSLWTKITSIDHWKALEEEARETFGRTYVDDIKRHRRMKEDFLDASNVQRVRPLLFDRTSLITSVGRLISGWLEKSHSELAKFLDNVLDTFAHSCENLTHDISDFHHAEEDYEKKQSNMFLKNVDEKLPEYQEQYKNFRVCVETLEKYPNHDKTKVTELRKQLELANKSLREAASIVQSASKHKV